MFSNFKVVTHSSDFKQPFVGSNLNAPILNSPGASLVAGSGEQTSVAGFGGAGNEFDPSSTICRGVGDLPACPLTVTRHTSYAAAAGSCPQNVDDAGVSSGREHFRLRARDTASACGLRVAGSSGGREHSRLRRRDNNNPRGVGDVGVSGKLGSLRALRPSAMAGGSATTHLRGSSGRVSTPAVASGGVALGCSASALRARDVRGVNSGGMRKASSSKDSSVVVMHGHRMRSDFDLDSVFVPHSRSFSLCSSVVSKVSNSSSINSCGEHGSALGHKNSCNVHAAEVRGGTKALSMSTRLGVRCPAVEELASPQQAPGSLHEEVWASILHNQGPKIFREVEIIPGCAASVASPSCPDYSPEPPGPGRIIRNMIGWSLLEKNEVGSGVWLFRGALQGKNLFSSLDVTGGWVRKGSFHTAWAVPCDSLCSCSYSYGQGPAIGPHTGRRCWPLLEGVWRAIAPLMKPWCAEGEVPTAANLNLYRGGNSCVGWHRDDELLFGEFGEAKLIVSVSLGGSAVFRWKRRFCPDDEGHLCCLGHGDILVMDGRCQDKFLHRTDPCREQERINITFRWIKQHVSSCPLFRTGVACCLPTCAQGLSVPVIGNSGYGIFWVFWLLFCVLCAGGLLALLASLLHTRLGFLWCASCWTRLLDVVQWGHYLWNHWRECQAAHKIAFHYWVRDVFIHWKPYMLALAGRPSLHGNYACMVYWTQGAPRRNCRQKYGETSFSPFGVFLISRNSRERFWGLVFWHLWIGRARHPGPFCYFSPFRY